MKSGFFRFLLLLLVVAAPFGVCSQTIPDKLAAAFKIFTSDAQMRNGLASLYVVDAKTGQVVFNQNGSIGLAPASTQKIITSVSAYELLGKSFRYQTSFGYSKNQEQVSLLISPSGDPTLGSWRWPQTRESVVVKRLTLAIKKLGVKSISGVFINNTGWPDGNIPDGWMWQDIGNYYGAGAAKLNWRENQFDVILKSGSQIGSPVTIVKTVPTLANYPLKSVITAAAAGTGDNAYIYFPLNAATGIIRGTIPVNESKFKISGALPAADRQFIFSLADTLNKLGISFPKVPQDAESSKTDLGKFQVFHSIQSPPLDSLIFYFNRKSINLYGEALIKTIAYKKTGQATTDKGVSIVKEFWKQNGIPSSELNLVDGSGLSPLNRVTTQAQVKILQHAQKQTWYNGFYQALPLYNGMKMKSGTIQGVKGYCGYHRSKEGKEYIFAFLVNNYNGSASGLVQKMYKVLDVLK